MAENYKGFAINNAGDPKPWGTKEEAAIKAIIDTLVGDTYDGVKSTTGHKHVGLYSSCGTRVVEAITRTTEVVVDRRNVIIHGPENYGADGDKAMVAFAGPSSQFTDYAGICAKYGFGIKLAVFADGVHTGTMSDNSMDVINIQEQTGEVGIMKEPDLGIALDVNGIMKATDMYTSEWVDWSASCVLNGWSGTPAKFIKYRRVGKMLFLQLEFYGTNNDPNVHFSIPATISKMILGGGSSPILGMLMAVKDAAPTVLPAYALLDGLSGTTVLIRRADGGSWDGVNGLNIRGNFWLLVD